MSFFILCIKNIYGCQDKFLNLKLSMFLGIHDSGDENKLKKIQ